MSSGSVVSAGALQTMSADALEMEDWEVAPGRIRSENPADPDNIAYSNSYLATNQAVSLSEDMTFRVEVLRPGTTCRFDVEPDSYRVCSLASGKLRVRIEGEPEFQVGPHGVFKIKPGATCAVENRLYIDSVLHISAMKSYS